MPKTLWAAGVADLARDWSRSTERAADQLSGLRMALRLLARSDDRDLIRQALEEAAAIAEAEERRLRSVAEDMRYRAERWMPEV
jgi:hypothetical protein